jgi:hypothetical protein
MTFFNIESDGEFKKINLKGYYNETSMYNIYTQVYD